MRKVLVIMEEMPVSENGEGGGSLIVKNHFDLLSHVFSGIDVLFIRNNQSKDRPVPEMAVHDKVSNVYILNARYDAHRPPWKTKLLSVRRPEYFVFPILNESNVLEVQEIIKNSKPDIIWAEHLSPVILSFYAARVPIVYAHHDWAYKLRKLREHKNSLRYRVGTLQMRRAENRIVSHVEGVISSSQTEASECAKRGAKNVIYIPACISPSTVEINRNSARSGAIYHFGGMRTTANRRGLERFLEVCWPSLKEALPGIELIVVGSLNGATEKILKCLEDPQVTGLGFVPNLEEVLKPYAINIIPWEYNTGTRTKIPFVLRSRQVLISTEAAVKGFPELRDNENVLMVRNLGEMTDRIMSVYDRAYDLERIGDNAYKTYEDHFVINKHIGRFRAFMDRVSSGSSSASAEV